MVLDACPDIADYARAGIANWSDFVATAGLVRSMLGVSPSAVEVMGERQAATVVAAILQRAQAISSAGGYLRDLTRKAQAGQFSLGPMLMALIGRRKREKKRARRRGRRRCPTIAAARTEREARPRSGRSRPEAPGQRTAALQAFRRRFALRNR